MKKYLCITLVLLAVAFTSFTMGQSNKKEMEGDKPYTPTKLEWLAVECNAELRIPFDNAQRFTLLLSAIENEDTIVTKVTYSPGVDRLAMNLAVQHAREAVTEKALMRGWTWVKIKECVVDEDGEEKLFKISSLYE